jgi:hypothetical protein
MRRIGLMRRIAPSAHGAHSATSLDNALVQPLGELLGLGAGLLG